jgi:hypothetical protein
MHAAIGSIITFPPIAWWAAIIDRDTVVFDDASLFQKSQHPNRYVIPAANGPIKLSVPLLHGRDQKITLNNLQISYDANWQVQHMRALVSAYRRTPFFEHYEAELNYFFDNRFTFLAEFSMASIGWVKKQLKLNFSESVLSEKIDQDTTTDLRRISVKANDSFPKYYQLFEDRIGFQPNMTILDLLFSEGPYAAEWIRKNKVEILKSVAFS